MKFDDDAFEAAKRLSLLAFFEKQVGTTAIKQRGLSATFNTCPSCGPARHRTKVRVSVTDDYLWRCFACGLGGSIVDAAACLWTFTPLQAALHLTQGGIKVENRANERKVKQWREDDERRRTAVRSVIAAIFEGTRRSWDHAVERYLVDRGLTLDVISEAGRRGLLGALPSGPHAATQWLLHAVGEDQLRNAGLWELGKQRPWIAYRPLVFFLPGLASAEFRTLSPRPRGDGDAVAKSVSIGRHESPYWWSAQQCTRCIVVEGMLDLLSAITLGYPGCAIGVAGVNNWRIEWFAHAARLHGVRQFDIAFDNDVDSDVNAGQLAANKLLHACAEAGLPAQLCPPAIGDLNDLLRTRQAANASTRVERVLKQFS